MTTSSQRGDRAGKPGTSQNGPEQADVDALRGVLDLMEDFADNDQRARYLLSCNWMRERLARRQDDAELLDALRLRLREARA